MTATPPARHGEIWVHREAEVLRQVLRLEETGVQCAVIFIPWMRAGVSQEGMVELPLIEDNVLHLKSSHDNKFILPCLK